MLKFEFGEKVRILGSLIRSRQGNNRTWIEHPLPVREGIFLGSRTLSNGFIDYSSSNEYGESDYYFHHKTYIPGACICIKGRNPENVFLSQVEKL